MNFEDFLNGTLKYTKMAVEKCERDMRKELREKTNNEICQIIHNSDKYRIRELAIEEAKRRRISY